MAVWTPCRSHTSNIYAVANKGEGATFIHTEDGLVVTIFMAQNHHLWDDSGLDSGPEEYANRQDSREWILGREEEITPRLTVEVDDW